MLELLDVEERLEVLEEPPPPKVMVCMPPLDDQWPSLEAPAPALMELELELELELDEDHDVLEDEDEEEEDDHVVVVVVVVEDQELEPPENEPPSSEDHDSDEDHSSEVKSCKFLLSKSSKLPGCGFAHSLPAGTQLYLQLRPLPKPSSPPIHLTS